MQSPACPNPPTPDPAALSGYHVLVAVCGGIAAYKCAAVVSALVQRGAAVRVAMTRAARRFVTPLTFESLTARPAVTSLWTVADPFDPQHLALTEAADLVLVAPATANILAKIAHGLADDLVSTLLLSVAGPVLLAPAMNTRMWENPFVQRNVATLREAGHHFVGPGSGWLACRTVGAGRMAEPDEIVAQCAALLLRQPPRGRASGSPS
ncbi:MAG: flavoprotein [Phycisphaerae bacterium]